MSQPPITPWYAPAPPSPTTLLTRYPTLVLLCRIALILPYALWLHVTNDIIEWRRSELFTSTYAQMIASIIVNSLIAGGLLAIPTLILYFGMHWPRMLLGFLLAITVVVLPVEMHLAAEDFRFIAKHGIAPPTSVSESRGPPYIGCGIRYEPGRGWWATD